MKKICFALVLSFLFAAPMAQAQSMYGRDGGADAQEARMNRDGYPYTVLSRGPILTPKTQRDLRQYAIRMEAAERAYEADKVRQFRTMSADERRYVIQTQGYPAGQFPGYKRPY